MRSHLQISNLSDSSTEQDLLQLFASIGPVVTVEIVRNARTGRVQGPAVVEMAKAADAVSAVKRLNFSQFHGRVVSVSLSDQLMTD